MTRKGARIIVAQTYDFVLRFLSWMRNAESPNEVLFTTSPGRVLYEVQRSAWDVVISGAIFNQSDLQTAEEWHDLMERARREGVHVIGKHYRPPKLGPGRGTQLASRIRRISPETLCLRMTVMPELPLGRFGGDIPKEDLSIVVDFIDSTELIAILAARDWRWLRQRFPLIQFIPNLEEYYPDFLRRN